MTSTKKIIVVVGATGNQGTSVARTFLSLGCWHVRCLTRDPSSPKAQALASQGAEVVEADLGGVSSLSRAFQDAHAIFVNTDFWTTYTAGLAAGTAHDEACRVAFDTEVLHGKNAAAAAAGVPTLERFVYSAFASMKAASGGKYSRSFHWEGKAEVVDHIFKTSPLAAKTSLIYMGAYATNALLYPKLEAPREAGGGGGYVMRLPCGRDSRFPIVDPTESTGPFVRALVEDEPAGTRLLAYDQDSYLTIGRALELWVQVTGREAEFVETPARELHELTGLPFEVLEAPVYLGEFEYAAGVPGVIEPAQLRVPVKTRSYEEFLKGRPLQKLFHVETEL